ncbi:MAG: hypothetical protein OHK0013_02310 [Sandaracinaceae bacterium]
MSVTSKIVLNRLSAWLFLALCVGSGLYALAAVPLEWPPVSWIIEREALFRGGTYGMVEAWVVAWLHLLAVEGAPLALFGVVAAARSARHTPDLGRELADRTARLRRRRLIGGVLVTFATLAFYAALIIEPHALEPVGFLGRLGLILGPFAIYAGPALVLDATLPLCASTVVVESIQDAPEDPERRFINARWNLSPAEVEGVALGSELAIVATPIFETVVSVTRLPANR